jgi:putative glycerol-1-phosphate prenyltransferase
MQSIYNQYLSSSKKRLAILIDPEKWTDVQLKNWSKKIEKAHIDFVLLGSSLSSRPYDDAIQLLKKHTQKPVLLFPGNSLQLSAYADALLNLSLISGRNAELLIGEQVRSAVIIKNLKLETIPTGYILIDGGTRTSVEYMSQTSSIPREKTDIAVATALAGTQLGLKCIYLEAGSGAMQSVPNSMITAVKQMVEIPVIVGGGIRTLDEIESKWKAGADVVVVGTAFERDGSLLEALS